VIVPYDDLNSAFSAARQLRSGREPIAALEVAFWNGDWLLATRIEGREETVDSAVQRIISGVAVEVTRRDRHESASWWSTYMRQQQVVPGDNAVLVRCGVRPKETFGLARGVGDALGGVGVDVAYLAASPGLGVVVTRLDFGDEGSSETLATAQGVLLGLADTVTVLGAPPSWKRGIDVWGRLPEGFDVMQALRQQFDPQRTINPGRFAGFL
jgi:glycolate oxidase FAD binding subunit